MKVMKVIQWVFGALFVLILLTCSGQVWLLQVPWTLVVGWLQFLLRVVPEMTWRWGAIAETVVVGAVLGVGTHLFLRRMWRKLRPEDARPWPVRWSVSLVALIVLLFGATMATVGIGHHVGWLASDRARMLESSWRHVAWRLESDNVLLCQDALRLSESGVPDARVAQVLLGDADKRNQAERLHVVPRRGPGGEAGFLVFPRDPVTRERAGGVHCGGGLAQRESVEAAELPRLLSERQVATDTAP